MRVKLVAALIIFSISVKAQELYVFTEPASNMAAKSVGLRLNNSFMKERYQPGFNYHLVPEIMVGVSKKIMIHGEVFLSNRNKSLVTEGAGGYIKYRFLSNDDVQKHFRMAAFSRVGFNNSDIHQDEINITGHNTGWETGIIATQLLHKVAISSGVSFIKANDNSNGHKFPFGERNSNAVNYTLSIGKLMLPKEYTDYKQTNLNLMIELLSQYNIGSHKYYIDAAPSLQLIFNSRSRIDVGYRKQLGSTFHRTAPNGFLIRLEYSLFNAW